MKYGPTREYWSNFIFEAYVNYRTEAIYLAVWVVKTTSGCRVKDLRFYDGGRYAMLRRRCRPCARRNSVRTLNHGSKRPVTCDPERSCRPR